MREFVITTETNSDLLPEYLTENHIGIIPHYYELDEVVYGEEITLSVKEFYDAMRAGKMPTTMASNPAVIRDTFEGYVQEGFDVLHISFSSALSGAFSIVSKGAEEICEKYLESKIIVFDTLNVSLGEGMMIIEAVRMKNEGKTIEETVAWLEEHKQEFCVQFTVDDLFHLHRGGRLSKTTAILGSVINIKPILHVNEEGGLVSIGTVRGRKKSFHTIINNMLDRMGKYKTENPLICILHGDVYEEALLVKEMIKEKIPGAEFIVNSVGPSIGAHSGPGAIGIIFKGEKK